MSTGSVIATLMRCLGGGRRVPVQTVAGRTSFHCYYNTVVQTSCPSSASITAELRVYSPKDGVVFPDNTVVPAYVRVYIPSNGTVLLDAIQVCPFPGDPSVTNAMNISPTLALWARFAIFPSSVVS